MTQCTSLNLLYSSRLSNDSLTFSQSAAFGITIAMYPSLWACKYINSHVIWRYFSPLRLVNWKWTLKMTGLIWFRRIKLQIRKEDKHFFPLHQYNSILSNHRDNSKKKNHPPKIRGKFANWALVRNFNSSRFSCLC